MIKIYYLYIFDLCPHFLAFSSQNHWNFLRGKSNERIFCSNIWPSPQFLKSFQDHKGEMSVLFIASPLPTQLGLYVNEMTFINH